MIPSIVAREMMVSNLITLSPEMDVFDAIDVFLRERISGAPVVDRDGQFLGIFSERSCMRFVLDTAYEQRPTNTLKSYIDANPPVITGDTDFLTIAQTFIDAACRRLPVVDDQGRLIGQISRRDLMRAARKHIGGTQASKKQQGLYISALYEDGKRPI